jgi:hypothetical protein
VPSPQVHDEVVVEVPEGREGSAMAALKGAMEGVMDLGVPIKVTGGGVMTAGHVVCLGPVYTALCV